MAALVGLGGGCHPETAAGTLPLPPPPSLILVVKNRRQNSSSHEAGSSDGFSSLGRKRPVRSAAGVESRERGSSGGAGGERMYTWEGDAADADEEIGS